MTKAPTTDVLNELRKIDTPTITNVVATYPKNPLCLGLYNPWTENWYTDTSIRCIYPEMGAIVGYAVTCVFGLPDPNYAGRLSFMDVVDALDAMQRPTILVIQQKWPAELMAKAGLAGEIMVTSMKAVGCIGMLSNGPSRDVDAVRKLNFQMLLGGVTAGHGEMAVQAVNVPVSVGGMDVAPGDLIHMDENGAVKFPADKAEQVLDNARKMLEGEAEHLARLRTATTAAEVRAAGGSYAAKRAEVICEDRTVMLKDRYGLAVSTTSATARDAYVQGCDLYLSMNPGALAAFDRAIAADPGFALAFAGKAGCSSCAATSRRHGRRWRRRTPSASGTVATGSQPPRVLRLAGRRPVRGGACGAADASRHLAARRHGAQHLGIRQRPDRVVRPRRAEARTAGADGWSWRRRSATIGGSPATTPSRWRKTASMRPRGRNRSIHGAKSSQRLRRAHPSPSLLRGRRAGVGPGISAILARRPIRAMADFTAT